MSRADGFKPGTNYNQKIAAAHRPEPAAVLAALLGQDEACRQGKHDAAEARPGYVTHVAGVQVPPGTRYCRYCSTILEGESCDE